MQQDSMSTIRSGLKARIEALATGPGQGGLAGLSEQIDMIRHDATRHGLIPVAQLAAALEEMLAGGRLGRAITSSLDLMRDAVECEDNGPEAGTVYMAALSARYGF